MRFDSQLVLLQDQGVASFMSSNGEIPITHNDGSNASEILSKAFAAALPMVFELAAIWRIALLWSSPVSTRAGTHLLVKQILILSLLGLQVYLAFFYAKSPLTTAIDLVISVVTVSATLLLAPLSFLEHKRTIAPSILIGLFLWTSVIQGAVEAVQLLAANQDASGLELTRQNYVSLASTVVQLALAVVEELPKGGLIAKDDIQVASEATVGLIGWISFSWLNSLLWKGYKGKLGLNTLDSIDDAFESRRLLAQIRLARDQQRNEAKEFSLLWALWSAFKVTILWTMVPRLFQTVFQFAQPLLISALINFIDPNSEATTAISGTQLVCFAGVTYLGVTISTAMYNHLRNRFLVILRGGLIAALIEKSFVQNLFTTSEDTAVTLMSADIEGLTSGVQEIHEVWGCAVDLAISMYLLYREIGLASLLVGGPAFMCFFLSERVSDGIGPARGGWAQAAQDRVAKTSSFLSQIKSLKMMGLTNLVNNVLQKLRIKEVEESKMFRKYIVWIIGVGNLSNQLTPAVIIIAAIFWTRAGGEGLTIAQAFTSLSIVNLVSVPIAELSTIHPTLVASMSCLNRIQAFLLSSEKQDDRVGGVAGSPLIQLQNVDATVLGKTDALLKKATLEIQQSTVNMVIGPVGSGKSIFLKTLLGEVSISNGTLAVGYEAPSVAFCDQSPWLRNVSIRQNILSYMQFDGALYDKILTICSLKSDLERLPQGDRTVVGSGGVSLSGGQRHRVALARALYSRRDILVLDDIFSALDAATSSKIANALFGAGGYLRENGRTVILVTSSRKHLSLADNIIVLNKDHEIGHAGEYETVKHEDDFVQQLDTEDSSEPSTAVDSSDEAIETHDKEEDEQETELAAAADWDTYKFYVSSVEPWYLIIFVIFAIGFSWVGKLPQVWLGIWTDHGTTTGTALYFTVYVALCVFTIAFSVLIFWWFGLYVIPRSGLNIHQMLLDSYLRAPLWFLTGVDNGSILNRFSQDLSLIDQEMPFAVFEALLGVLDTFAVSVIICYSAPYLVAVMAVSFVVIGVIQRFYLKTSVTIRRLDIETKAPLYALFTDTRTGLATIRAFGWQGKIMDEGLDLLDVSQKPYYLMMAIQQWLSLVIGLVTALISVLLVLLAVTQPSTTSGVALGLALVNLMYFNGGIHHLVVAWTKMETSLGAAARVRAFARDTPNENNPDQKRRDAPPNWPIKGDIAIDNITSSYKKGDRAIVEDVSVDIKAGQFIGICGSTGSGKTSLLLTILGLLDTSSGGIKIDGVDLKTTSLHDIRSRLAVLPQDAVQFPGSVRDNLQLDRQYRDDESSSLSSDADMKASLEKLGLWEVIERVENSVGLDTDFASLSLSHGQKQLFAIARTLLDKSQVVFLDEATSSIDEHTETQIQNVMRKAFKGRTLLSVAHRLDSIIDFDKVVVMDGGKVIEVGDPKLLMEQKGSAFKKLREQ